MVGKRPGSCDEFSAILPVLIAGINRYEIFANQLFELGFNVKEVTLPYDLTNFEYASSACAIRRDKFVLA